MLFNRKSKIIRPNEEPVIARRDLLRAGAIGAALGSLATKPALASYTPQPTIYGNNQNTILQIANPGTGSTNNTSAENIAFYDNDGDLVIGPGNRADITELHNSPINLFKRHMHLRFDQVQFSSSRPVQQLSFIAIGGGTFAIVSGSSGGQLQMSTNTGAAGDGGTAIEDGNPIVLSNGTKFYVFMNPITSSSNQIIRFGAQLNSLNQIQFSRSDIATEGFWACSCTASGTTTSVVTAVKTALSRTIFCISYDSGVVNFWIGNSNNTLILVTTISTNIPTGQNLNTFVNITSQGSAVNRVLAVSDMYTITNA